MTAPARFILGLDLGLCTGWAVWDCDRNRLHRHGVIDVRKIEDEHQRMYAWAEDLRRALSGRVEAVAFEEVRHMHGQGARYILMQQGILLDWCFGHEVLCAGVNVATLKGWARRYGTGVPMGGYGAADTLGPTLKTAADMQHHLDRRLPVSTNAYQLTEDEAMATWAALWLRDAVEDGAL